MNICYADIETTKIPLSGVPDVSEIHCIAVKSNDDETLCFTSVPLAMPNYGGTLDEALDYINKHDYVVFHNGMGFDLIVIEQLLGEVKPVLLDTLMLTTMLYDSDTLMSTDIYVEGMPKALWGRHSLEAFGYRVGLNKGEYSDWSKLTIEMVEYCINDVEVTYHLFNEIKDHPNFPSMDIIALENEVAYIIAQQQYFGFYFDIKAARNLYQQLLYEKLTIYRKLLKTFKPLLRKDGNPIEPAAIGRRTRIYVPNLKYIKSNAVWYKPKQFTYFKNGKIKLRGINYYKWFTEPNSTVYSYTEGTYQKIKLEPFDPGSRNKIRYWLNHYYQFQFSTYTEKGTPKVDGDELEALGSYGADLRRYLKIVKDSSQLKALIEAIRPDSTITSRINTNGTVTGRFTSSNVNLNQIPAQAEFRELFTAPEGWVFIGTDFDGQENVNLAEILYPYDKGRLDDIIRNGDKDKGTDLHSLNGKACNVSRSDSKPLWFGFLYGSSSTLTGFTLLGNKDFTDYTEAEFTEMEHKLHDRVVDLNGEEYYPIRKGQIVPFNEQLIKQALFGKQVQDKLVSNTDGLSDVIKFLEAKVRKDGYIETLGGRRIPVDSPHKCLNYFCQGQGAESMKHYIRCIHHKFSKAGLVHGIDFIHQATIYDEIDLISKVEHVETIKEILTSCYTDISRELGMKTTYTGGVMVGSNWQECH